MKMQSGRFQALYSCLELSTILFSCLMVHILDMVYNIDFRNSLHNPLASLTYDDQYIFKNVIGIDNLKILAITIW